MNSHLAHHQPCPAVRMLLNLILKFNVQILKRNFQTTYTLQITNEPSKDPTVQDVISYWKDLFSRFTYLSKLTFYLLVLPVSSASSEREFSIARWHCLGRKNRSEEKVLATKFFLTCSGYLLRPLLFLFGRFCYIFLCLFNQQFRFVSAFFIVQHSNFQYK